MNKLESKDGWLTYANIAPLFGLSATIAPLYFPKAFSATCWI
jgi:hypothetical protein